MSIAAMVQTRLSEAGVPYDIIEHPRTSNSSHTAQAAHVPGERLAKSVVLEDGDRYLMAVVPATLSVDLGALHRRWGRELGLATEEEVAKLFADCEPGAVPPLGQLYGIETILDEAFVDAEDVYFEGGDHRALVHVNGSDFLKLMGDVPRARIGLHH
ncbi:MAG TPA: YbaK/EbsC family protein [Steroidobacteraceae bacterium]|jgi:Ala-tRNA(Pro) deacylase|nr:YbaK/EbsC family protein [Steroidobacteraceae bacterium]